MTGADSPVIADSSTEAMPSMTVPSPGISSPASTTTTSPRRELGGRPPRAVGERRDRVLAHRPQRRRLGLAAALGDRLGEVAEEHGEPQPDRDGEREPAGLRRARPRSTATVVKSAPTSTTNMTGLRTISRGSSLRAARAPAQERRSRSGPAWRRPRGAARPEVGHRDASRSSARLSSSTLTDCGLASPRNGRLAWSSTSASTRSSGAALGRHAVGLDAGVGVGDVRVHARGRRRHRVGRDARRRRARRVTGARGAGTASRAPSAASRRSCWFGPWLLKNVARGA